MFPANPIISSNRDQIRIGKELDCPEDNPFWNFKYLNTCNKVLICLINEHGVEDVSNNKSSSYPAFSP